VNEIARFFILVRNHTNVVNVKGVFFYEKALEVHQVLHSHEKLFVRSECSKSFYYELHTKLGGIHTMKEQLGVMSTLLPLSKPYTVF
uniref:Uncharacterized protein n=1 Tax=Scleropages formosus TaxID=113540 RepID=A0A8C9UY56_SCLFO